MTDEWAGILGPEERDAVCARIDSWAARELAAGILAADPDLTSAVTAPLKAAVDLGAEYVDVEWDSVGRIRRGADYQSPNTKGLYPAGEGAGFAGGILSAAVDGIRVAEAVAKSISG